MSLKQRVLMNETLNQFKKEVSQIAELIDKRDPTWSAGYTQNIAQKLAAVLQKQNVQEILYMLQRTQLLEKRKKRKGELEKTVQLTKSKIEIDVRQQLRQGDDDYVDLQ